MSAPKKKDKYVVVLVTTPNTRLARKLAKLLVKDRLAACVNIVPHIKSIFMWKKKLEQSNEVLLIVKTTRNRLQAAKKTILTHHPYDVPEVIAVPVTSGNESYLKWVSNSVK